MLDPEASSSSKSSHGSADEEFNQQRKNIRQKLGLTSQKSSETKTPEPQQKHETPSDESSEEDEAYSKRIEEER